jgi:PTH1 family peptidyl-tRNA hydrolase
VEHLGTQAFNRIRIGIDHPRNSANPQMAVEDYVLFPFLPAEKMLIDQTIDTITTELINLLGH